MKKILLKILRFFALVIAVGAGVCCGIQAWIECDRKGIFDKKKIIIASADTYDDITDEDGQMYYCLGTDICLANINIDDEGDIVVFNGYNGDAVVCSSSAVITFEEYIDSSQYITLEKRKLFTSEVTFVRNPYYIFSFNRTIDSFSYTVIDSATSTAKTYTFNDFYFSLITKVWVRNYENGYNAGQVAGESAGYETGYNAGLNSGYSEGYGIGLQEGYNIGYSEGNSEGYDLGYYDGRNYGYNRGLLDSNRGMWATVFDFSFGNDSANDVTVYVQPENYDVYQNGGISFAKLQPLYYEACELQSVTPENIDTTPMTVTVRITPSSTDIKMLSTGTASIVGFDGYYTADDLTYWGSWSNIDSEEEIDVYSFDTYSELSVIPDTFTFTFDSTWDFHVYLTDQTIGFTDYSVGYTQGSTDGYEEGYGDAYETAYNKGYVDGKAFAYSQVDNTELSSSVRSFVFSVFDAPVSTFLDSFNFQVGDFDLGGLIAFIFTLILVAAVWKVIA